MKLYRLAHIQYMHDTSGAGAHKWGGRWNPPGFGCVYTSEHLSLSMLEKMVHAQAIRDMKNVALMIFEILNREKIYQVEKGKLKQGWQQDVHYTQWMGKQIMQHGAFTGFAIPSIITPMEQNVVLMPDAFEKGHVVQKSASLFEFDSRLIRYYPD